MSKNSELFERRRLRARAQIRKKGHGRPRLSVHRTLKHIYVQVIDDAEAKTLAAASSLDAELKSESGGTKEIAAKVGRMVAERAKKAGIDKVVFDRGGFIFHGRVKALAEGAREGGLDF